MCEIFIAILRKDAYIEILVLLLDIVIFILLEAMFAKKLVEAAYEFHIPQPKSSASHSVVY